MFCFLDRYAEKKHYPLNATEIPVHLFCFFCRAEILSKLKANFQRKLFLQNLLRSCYDAILQDKKS